MADIFRTLIVPAANVEQARAIAADLPGGGPRRAPIGFMQ